MIYRKPAPVLVLLTLISAGCTSDGNMHANLGAQKEAVESSAQKWNGGLKEHNFLGITWGISKTSFQKAYISEPEHIKLVPNVLQDPSMLIHGNLAIGGFSFDQRGLYMIAASFWFEVDGKRLFLKDVLTKSDKILSELRALYGKPWIAIPWDGNTFVYIWRSQETFVQFAWDGANSWGIHFRSMKLDPEIPQALSHLEQLKKQL